MKCLPERYRENTLDPGTFNALCTTVHTLFVCILSSSGLHVGWLHLTPQIVVCFSKTRLSTLQVAVGAVASYIRTHISFITLTLHFLR